ncbi:down syndrome cell adhesion molecule-like protein Dscam2 [Trichonephila clavipes]|nr:down syndrome cell adhesion molecule-like protein Dscam2 [Trichonephila clavipes]
MVRVLEVTPKCLGGPPLDRDRRNAHPGFRGWGILCSVFRLPCHLAVVNNWKHHHNVPLQPYSQLWANSRGFCEKPVLMSSSGDIEDFDVAIAMAEKYAAFRLSQTRAFSESIGCNLDFDEDIKLNESECEEYEENADLIDNILVNPDTYMLLGGHRMNTARRFVTRNVSQKNSGRTSFSKHNVNSITL